MDNKTELPNKIVELEDEIEDLKYEIEDLSNHINALEMSKAITVKALARAVEDRKAAVEHSALYGLLAKAIYGNEDTDVSVSYLLKEAYGLLKHKGMLGRHHMQRLETAIDVLNDLEVKLGDLNV